MPVLPVSDEVEFSAKVPRDLYDRFRGLVPQYGGTTWFINSALAHFVSTAEEHPGVEEHVDASVRAMVGLNRQLGVMGRLVEDEELTTIERKRHA